MKSISAFKLDKVEFADKPFDPATLTAFVISCAAGPVAPADPSPPVAGNITPATGAAGSGQA